MKFMKILATNTDEYKLRLIMKSMKISDEHRWKMMWKWEWMKMRKNNVNYI